MYIAESWLAHLKTGHASMSSLSARDGAASAYQAFSYGKVTHRVKEQKRWTAASPAALSHPLVCPVMRRMMGCRAARQHTRTQVALRCLHVSDFSFLGRRTTPEEGGETVFPQAATRVSGPEWSECASKGLAVKTRKGDALLFYRCGHPSLAAPTFLLLRSLVGVSLCECGEGG